MPHPSHAESSHAFCSYCGYPHAARWRGRPHLVCGRCQLGYIVRTTAGFIPRSDEPFLIVDERLRVQAVSSQAEEVLLVSGADGFGAPLGAFLVSDDDGDQTGAELAARIARASAGTPASGALALRTAGEPEVCFTARVSCCGPPAGALLVLTPVDGHEHNYAGFVQEGDIGPGEFGGDLGFLMPRVHARGTSGPGRL